MMPSKNCQRCGRLIEWRKKWEHSWDDLRYCSARCRSQKRSKIDEEIEIAILALLAKRSCEATICPSEVARAIFSEERWRDQMEQVRQAARRLVVDKKIEILQRGNIADPSTAKGPIRLRLKKNIE